MMTPVSHSTQIERTSVRLSPNDLTNAPQLALPDGAYVGVLLSSSLGSASFFTALGHEGRSADQVILEYATESGPAERVWTRTRDHATTYRPAEDTSSTGYVSRALRGVTLPFSA